MSGGLNPRAACMTTTRFSEEKGLITGTRSASTPNTTHGSRNFSSGDSSKTASSGDVEILKFNPSGELVGEYHFGSNGEDVATAMTVGPSTGDRPWITGKTCGNAFPTTDGITHQMKHCGVFVLVLENNGIEDLGMVLGGADGDDEGVSIASNGSQTAYIAGVANSTTFPATTGAFQTVKNPGPQAFVAQVDASSPAGSLVRSTFFGADGTTMPYSITNNNGQGVYLTGSTSFGSSAGWACAHTQSYGRFCYQVGRRSHAGSLYTAPRAGGERRRATRDSAGCSANLYHRLALHRRP